MAPHPGGASCGRRPCPCRTTTTPPPPPPPPDSTPSDPAPQNLAQPILDDISAHKYETPTPIQCQGIPVALSGCDILGCAETGSGKTASFAIPMIQHCLNQPPIRSGDGPLALVLAPTRELAQQIDKEVRGGPGCGRLGCPRASPKGGAPPPSARASAAAWVAASACIARA